MVSDIWMRINVIFCKLIWVIVWKVMVVFNKIIENFSNLFLVILVLWFKLVLWIKVFFKKIFSKIVIVVVFKLGN